jgi:shikimate dehydrogenase
MRKFGLIGYPLGHSFSKKYFADKFLKEGISDCQYENFPLNNINEVTRLIAKEHELCGFNVTIPYKTDIIKFLNSVDPEAIEIGSVNVVKIKRQRESVHLLGYNSDVTGIRGSLFPFLDENIKDALVLGTGGSSRSVCFVLNKYGIKVTTVSRKGRPGVLTYSDLNSNIIRENRLIVNTTPLGMFPDIESKPYIDYRLLGKKHILFDLVYNPELTAFLKAGEHNGSTIINGLKMLHLQAEKSWEIWNDNSL